MDMGVDTDARTESEVGSGAATGTGTGMGTGVGLPPGQRWIRRFIRYSALPPPEVDIDSYRLRVADVELSYGELLGMIDFRGKMDFHCVTGWSVAGVEMEGITFRGLGRIAEPRGRYAFFTSLEGYTSIVPIEDYLKGILLLRIDGRPLSYEEGFPARPFFEHLYAWKSAKWLRSIDFLEDYVDGYWEERGYHERGNVWLEERFKGARMVHAVRTPMPTSGERKS